MNIGDEGYTMQIGMEIDGLTIEEGFSKLQELLLEDDIILPLDKTLWRILKNPKRIDILYNPKAKIYERVPLMANSTYYVDHS